MTNGKAAPDPIAVASAIVQAAAHRAATDAESPEAPRPIAPVIVMAAGVLASIVLLVAMFANAAAITTWCLTHGPCP